MKPASDVAGQAQTGTGKTAAFLLATLNQLLLTTDASGKEDASGNSRACAIMLAPTRELAIQIFAKDAKVLGKHSGTELSTAGCVRR